MKTLPVIVLVTLIPVVTLARTTNTANDVEHIQMSPNTDEATIGNPTLAICTGKKCAGGPRKHHDSEIGADVALI
jgi:hypothetical protein